MPDAVRSIGEKLDVITELLQKGSATPPDRPFAWNAEADATNETEEPALRSTSDETTVALGPLPAPDEEMAEVPWWSDMRGLQDDDNAHAPARVYNNASHSRFFLGLDDCRFDLFFESYADELKGKTAEEVIKRYGEVTGLDMGSLEPALGAAI